MFTLSLVVFFDEYIMAVLLSTMQKLLFTYLAMESTEGSEKTVFMYETPCVQQQSPPMPSTSVALATFRYLRPLSSA